MLGQRVASAAAGIPVILLLIWFGGPWYLAAVCAALAVASVEFQHAQGRRWLDPTGLLIAAIVAGIAVGAYIGRLEWLLWLAAGAVIPAVAVAVNPVDATPGSARGDELRRAVAWTAGGVAYLGVLGGTLVMLRQVEFDGRDWVYVAVLGTFATDTGAFFIGRAVGRHLLAPTISPKKTVEGFLGGWMTGFAAVVAAAYAFRAGSDLVFEPWHVVVLGLTLPLAATVGDLVESAMKRARHIKDASELIPGHGGVLDRLDSILFTFPTVFLFVEYVVSR
ncbi:MAG TPA: phosphatidate cytidylyltransferase [Dehalococcoidia bacterium]|nr:phosphatidate cytidylyltransferase [Dehalococcoidia bacterium]